MNTINLSKSSGYGVSSRYSLIDTSNVVDAMALRGFELKDAKFARVRDVAKQGYQKHLLTFRHAETSLRHVGDIIPQVLLKNSYDGSSSFELMLGFYRLVCSNGLIVGSTYSSVRIKHVGSSIEHRVSDAALTVIGQADSLMGRIREFQSIQLSESQRHQFVQRAIESIGIDATKQIDVSSVLQPRRLDDASNDLWTVFNRVQESFIRGGYRVDGGRSTRRARAVRSIDRGVDINKTLWNVAETFAA